MRGTTPRYKPRNPSLAYTYLPVDQTLRFLGRSGASTIDCISTRQTEKQFRGYEDQSESTQDKPTDVDVVEDK